MFAVVMKRSAVSSFCFYASFCDAVVCMDTAVTVKVFVFSAFVFLSLRDLAEAEKLGKRVNVLPQLRPCLASRSRKS